MQVPRRKTTAERASTQGINAYRPAPTPAPRNGSIRPAQSTPPHEISDTPAITFSASGVSTPAGSADARFPKPVSKIIALSPAMIRNVTFNHHVGLLKYCAGSETTKITPVIRLSEKPKSANG